MKKIKIIKPAGRFINPIIAREEGRIVEVGGFNVGEIVIFPDELADLIIRKNYGVEI